MNQIKLEAMEQQFNQLKKETLRLKQLLLFVLASLFVVVLAGFQPGGRDQVVEATQFVLKDKNQKIQAKLFADADGFPSLCFYDKNDKCRMKVGIWGSSIGLSISDDDGAALVSLASSPGSSLFYMEEPGGKRASLGIAGQPDNSAVFSMGDTDGWDEFEIRAGSGWSRIDFLGDPVEENGGGSRHLRLVSDSKSESDIMMYDKNNKERFNINGKPNGKISINMALLPTEWVLFSPRKPEVPCS